MAMFKEVADIKTADMLDLPVPKANFHNISVKPSEIQKQMVAELAERAEKVRNGMVDASVDNMLKITNDGRKLALDQRLINPMLPDFEGSKLNACVDAMFETWVMCFLVDILKLVGQTHISTISYISDTDIRMISWCVE